MSTHKIVTSPKDSTKLDITIAESDAGLTVKLREVKADTNKRLWWFSSDESEQKKKEHKS